jgi:hypothetical protein
MGKTVKETGNSCQETAKEPAQKAPEENKIAILSHNVFREDDEKNGSRIVVELNIKIVMGCR